MAICFEPIPMTWEETWLVRLFREVIYSMARTAAKYGEQKF